MHRNESTKRCARKALLAAARPIREVEVEVSALKSWDGFEITASYSIEFAADGTGRYILLDYSGIPFGIKHISGAAELTRDVHAECGEQWLLLDLSKDGQDSAMVQLTIEVDWKIGAGAMAQPFFLVGTFLPRVIVTPLAGQLSVPRPLFFQSAHLPADIVTAGLQLGAGDWSPIHHPQLELVLFPKQETLAETEEQVLFVGEIARALPASRRADVARSLRNNLTRVASALDINPAVRTALYPHDDPLSLPREGNVLLLDTSEMLGLDETGRGMATQGLAKASAIWWGGGVSISGHVGAALMVGITQALALFCLRDMRPKSHFRTVEIVTRRRADIEVDGSSPAGLRAVKLSGEFGLSLAAALNQGTEVRTALRQMTKEFWGREIPPAVILERLREVGVEPPNGLHGLSGEYES